MRVVCISDTHGRHREIQLPHGDILIHAGDISHFGKEHQIKDFNEWLGSLPFSHKIVIAGNHEINGKFDLRKLLSNATYLRDQVVEVANLKIYGIAYYGYPTAELFTVPEVDILVSHNPPYTIGEHGDFGCKVLLEYVEKVKPKLHVFGHVHFAHGVYTNDNTTFINAAICGGKYEYGVAHSPEVFDL